MKCLKYHRQKLSISSARSAAEQEWQSQTHADPTPWHLARDRDLIFIDHFADVVPARRHERALLREDSCWDPVDGLAARKDETSTRPSVEQGGRPFDISA